MSPDDREGLPPLHELKIRLAEERSRTERAAHALRYLVVSAVVAAFLWFVVGCAVPLRDYATTRLKRCGCLESCSCSDCCGPEDCKCPKPDPTARVPQSHRDGTNAANLRGYYR